MGGDTVRSSVRVEWVPMRGIVCWCAVAWMVTVPQGGAGQDAAVEPVGRLFDELTDLLRPWTAQWDFRSRWRSLMGRSADMNGVRWQAPPKLQHTGMVAVRSDLIRLELDVPAIEAPLLSQPGEGGVRRRSARVGFVHLLRLAPGYRICIIDNDADRVPRVQLEAAARPGAPYAWAWPLLASGAERLRETRFGQPRERIRHRGARKRTLPGGTRMAYEFELERWRGAAERPVRQFSRFVVAGRGSYFVLEEVRVELLLPQGEKTVRYVMLDRNEMFRQVRGVPVPFRHVQLSKLQGKPDALARLFELLDDEPLPARDEDFQLDMRQRPAVAGLRRVPRDGLLRLDMVDLQDVDPTRYVALQESQPGVVRQPVAEGGVSVRAVLSAASLLAVLFLLWGYRWRMARR